MVSALAFFVSFALPWQDIAAKTDDNSTEETSDQVVEGAR